MPREAPTTTQRAHLVGIGTRYKHLGVAFERKDIIVVFQQRNRLASTLIASLLDSLTVKFGIVFQIGIGGVIQTQTHLQTQDSTNCIVDTLAAHKTLINSLHKQFAEIDVVRDHCHIDTRINRSDNGRLEVLAHHLSLVEIGDVSPIRNDHTVPAKPLFEPIGQ